ncbi:MAG: sigma-70 family RNA polymerase sigma factor [Gemmatimonadales bacterium]|nr:sigma-70 family RNA polymerase sigma factor [Gemmatimonadales bacterium]
MPVALDVVPRTDQTYLAESADRLPAEMDRLLAPLPADRETAWQEFVERYSRLLLRVAFAFTPGYDGAMDRYLFILEELRRDDFARLRRFAADGRGRFSTWLVVVARRLCVDHHRRCYGRNRTAGPAPQMRSPARQARQRLTDLCGDSRALDAVADLAQLDPLEALDELEPSDRLLLKLRYEQDLTAREIAALLGLPTPFHVYRRARAICALLRDRLTRLAAPSQR